MAMLASFLGVRNRQVGRANQAEEKEQKGQMQGKEVEEVLPGPIKVKELLTNALGPEIEKRFQFTKKFSEFECKIRESQINKSEQRESALPLLNKAKTYDHKIFKPEYYADTIKTIEQAVKLGLVKNKVFPTLYDLEKAVTEYGEAKKKRSRPQQVEIAALKSGWFSSPDKKLQTRHQLATKLSDLVFRLQAEFYEHGSYNLDAKTKEEIPQILQEAENRLSSKTLRDPDKHGYLAAIQKLKDQLENILFEDQIVQPTEAIFTPFEEDLEEVQQKCPHLYELIGAAFKAGAVVPKVFAKEIYLRMPAPTGSLYKMGCGLAKYTLSVGKKIGLNNLCLSGCLSKLAYSVYSQGAFSALASGLVNPATTIFLGYRLGCRLYPLYETIKEVKEDPVSFVFGFNSLPAADVQPNVNVREIPPPPVLVRGDRENEQKQPNNNENERKLPPPPIEEHQVRVGEPDDDQPGQVEVGGIEEEEDNRDDGIGIGDEGEGKANDNAPPAILHVPLE